MYAIVEIGGKQYKVEKDLTVNVDKFDTKGNEELTFENVILFSDGENVKIGNPYLSNVKIKAKSLGEFKGKKVHGVKFKKRKNHTKTIGQRAVYTRIQINELAIN